MALNRQHIHSIQQKEASSLEEEYKDTRIEKKAWKKNRIFSIIILILLLSFFLSLIF